LIYGLVGIVKLTDSISVFTVFQNHCLTSRLKVSIEPEGSCTLWNVICESQFKFELPEDDDISAALSDAANLLQFFRKSALDSFNNYAEPHKKYLQEQSDKYSRFLPATIEADLKNINANPDKCPDQVVPEDPFRVERYKAIGSH